MTHTNFPDTAAISGSIGDRSTRPTNPQPFRPPDHAATSLGLRCAVATRTSAIFFQKSGAPDVGSIGPSATTDCRNECLLVRVKLACGSTRSERASLIHLRHSLHRRSALHSSHKLSINFGHRKVTSRANACSVQIGSLPSASKAALFLTFSSARQASGRRAPTERK
jgi:hypothetical protein